MPALSSAPAAAVVVDGDQQLLAQQAHLGADLGGVGVLERVGQRLGDQVVDRRLDRSRQPALGQRVDVQRQRRARRQRGERVAEPVLGQPGRMQPAHQLAQLVARQRRLLARLVEQRAGAVGLLGQPALGHREHVAESDEALLGAVVEVAPDAPALLVGRLDDPHARGRDLGLAGAQRDLVAAALDLRGGAGAEDRQRGALVHVGLQAPARLDADVADLRARAAAHRHGEVGVQAVADGEVVVGEARDGALGEAHEVVLDDQRARRALDAELEALVQVVAVVADRQHAGALGRVAEHLGHERHLGGEGLGELARERAEEGLARHRGRPGRDRAQQVAAAAGRVVGFGCWEARAGRTRC